MIHLFDMINATQASMRQEFTGLRGIELNEIEEIKTPWWDAPGIVIVIGVTLYLFNISEQRVSAYDITEQRVSAYDIME